MKHEISNVRATRHDDGFLKAASLNGDDEITLNNSSSHPVALVREIFEKFHQIIGSGGGVAVLSLAHWCYTAHVALSESHEKLFYQNGLIDVMNGVVSIRAPVQDVLRSMVTERGEFCHPVAELKSDEP